MRVMQVRLRPARVGDLEATDWGDVGTLLVHSNSPPSPLRVGLCGAGAARPRMWPSPRSLDFGPVTYAPPPGASRSQCGSVGRIVRLQASGEGDVRVGAPSLDGDGDFEITGVVLDGQPRPTPSWPLLVPAGAALDLSLRFYPRRAAPAAHGGRLQVPNDTVDEVAVVELVGLATEADLLTETFEVPSAAKVDLLVVIDDSSSMSDDHPRMLANLDRLLVTAEAHGADYQIALILAEGRTIPSSVDPALLGPPVPADTFGRFRRCLANPPILTPAFGQETADPAAARRAAFRCLYDVDIQLQDPWNEAGLGATMQGIGKTRSVCSITSCPSPSLHIIYWTKPLRGSGCRGRGPDIPISGLLLALGIRSLYARRAHGQVRVAARQAGADLAPLIAGIHRTGQPALFDAAVEGAASLGLSGFVGLARLALADEVPVPVRRAAWRALEAGFEAEALAPVRARLEAAAPEVLAPPEPARPETPVASSRPAAAVAWDESAPARAAVARAPRRPPEVEGWEVADTAPARPATDPEAETVLDTARVRPAAPATIPPSEARTQPVRPAAPPPEATRPDPPAEPTRPTKPAVPPPEAPTLVDRPWSEAVPRGASGIRDPEPAPARAAPPPPRAPSPPPRPAPVATEAATILPSGPTAPRPRPRRAQVSLPRARKALQAALQLGQDGFRGLRTLADSSRVPSEVRIQALRHLAADFGKRAITPIFERALGSDDPAIQNTALSCVMIQRQVALAPVAALAARPDAEVATRVRAMRFISSRYPKQKTRELFEALLTAEAPELRKTALESLFTSMRFVAPDQIEQALINLLEEHDDFDVRISAAKALGAFGGPDAQVALRSAAGFFGHDALKDAAREALERLEG